MEKKMENQETFEFHVTMTANDLWHFSLYHANRGYLGFFNLLFTAAALFLLVTTWSQNTPAYRALLVVLVLLFPVWQPFQLYIKAKRQASLEVMKTPVHFVFQESGIHIQQADQTQDITWDQVVRVEGNRWMLMIYMDRIHAFLVPETAMNGQRAKFCKLLQEVLPKERRKRIER